VVRRNTELLAALGLMPPTPDVGLDAVEIGPGGEILFSLETDAASELLGPLGHGDLLSHRGRIAWRHGDLLEPFAPQPPIPDLGLDAAQILPNGEVYFSIEQAFFSQTLGRTVGRGDLLSNTGAIVRTHEDLLSRFQPPPIPTDFGLDAVHVWPNGEIWFSVEEGFEDAALGYVLPGDLLSDQGYVVYRSLDLVAAFSPLEDLADFGLDALFVITDVPYPNAPPTRPSSCTAIHTAAGAAQVLLDWTGDGRVFRLEEATSLPGTFLPASPIDPDLQFTIQLPAGAAPQRVYRLRQWP